MFWLLLNNLKAVFSSHAAPPASKLEMRKKLEGATAGASDPKDLSIPHDIVLSNTSGRKKKNGSHLVLQHLSSQVIRKSPAFLEMAKYLPAEKQ